MRANNSGTTIPMISLDVLRALPVQLPPLDVQRRVAELNLLIEQEHNLMNQLSTARRDLLRGWANQNTAHA
jgi:restriction endonuclease S subunit